MVRYKNFLQLSIVVFLIPEILSLQVWTVLHSHSLLISSSSSFSSMFPKNSNNNNTNDNNSDSITILGFGSLLSESSSRLTFPDLQNFRLARVPQYRRVFGHVASIFFQRNIARKETLEMASLSVEYVNDNYPGFIAAVFEIPATDNLLIDGSIPSMAFLEREEEFDIVTVPYYEMDQNTMQLIGEPKQGIICQRGSDEMYIQRWGQERFEKNYKQYGIEIIWNWTEGLRPCAVYLRHCYLAAEKMNCLDSFLDETFLVDRKTKLRDYMEQNPHILDELPPPELASRYSG